MASVRIPHSGGRKTQGYAKLIERVDKARPDAFAFVGRFVRCGADYDETEIRPAGWPDPPLLLEYVPSEGKARGWKAHDQAAEHILWTYASKTGVWRELGRASAVGSDHSWVQVLKPLAIAHLAPPPLVWRRTLAEARERIVASIDMELEAIEDGRQAALLSVVHDLIASRASFLPASEDFLAGRPVGKNADIQTKPSVVEFSLLSLPYIPGRFPQSTGSLSPSPLGESNRDTPNPLGESDANGQAFAKKELASLPALHVESDPVSGKFTAAEREGIRKVASAGGKALQASRTPEQRREAALKAANIRWAQVRAAAEQQQEKSA